MISDKNINNLYNNKFKMTFHNLPRVSFFCTDVGFPNISIDPQTQNTPFGNITRGGTKVFYDPLRITFRVDEDLNNYKEVHNWILGTSSSISNEYKKELLKSFTGIDDSIIYPDRIYTDATLITLTNVDNLNMKITFVNLHPINLTGLEFAQGDNQIITATASFKFDYYVINA